MLTYGVLACYMASRGSCYGLLPSQGSRKLAVGLVAASEIEDPF